MAIVYRVYWNAGTGGPVDLSAPLAVVPDTQYQTSPLQPGSDYTFLVRTYDTESGLEEANTVTKVRLILDDQGRDITQLPAPPGDVQLQAGVGGGCRVNWTYRPLPDMGRADGFRVTLTSTSNGAPAATSATVPCRVGQCVYTCAFGGPLPRGVYTAVVESFSSAGYSEPSYPSTCTAGRSTEAYSLGPIQVRQEQPLSAF